VSQAAPARTPSKHPRQPIGKPVSSQRYLDVAQIRDGVVVLRDGSLRAVVLVNAVNFALKSEEEQNALIFSYQGFLNSFNFPIQIVMQSRSLDLAHYLKRLDDQLAETTNELIQVQIIDYVQFIERLIQVANIMDKKFYVVIPFLPPVVHQRGLIDKLFHPAERLEVKISPAEFKAYRQELLERARIIMGGLASIGLRTALLGTQEVIELLYATYNPEEATKERLAAVESITGAYLHPSPAPGDGAPRSRQPPAADAPSPTQSPTAEPVGSQTPPPVTGPPAAVAAVVAPVTEPSIPASEPPPVVDQPSPAATVTIPRNDSPPPAGAS
jgi:hypothetical protein